MTFQIFMEYKITEKMIYKYETGMPSIIKELENLGAIDIHWYKAADQGNLYVEMFILSSMEEYETVKRLRRDSDHPVFGKMDEYVDGGMKKVHCWAFVEKSIENLK
ncbi:hypothetical protein [Evansella tamaricis]|uniref:NIPSNAP domain-containing protein n=1 Tax=Evansella tamaricis TaxID=2069301 RepID=A0ABS6JEL9_9BACI|nr:hypothetical protein [Evansella tamaricis]MBU9711840.1 hypothetical protein [Evansella tamaricis]